jgi:hypothetical protein
MRSVLCVAGFAAVLSACGGGGGTPVAPVTLANVYPLVTPTVGDYWLFQETVTTGAGTPLPTPSVYTYARTYTNSNPIVRVDLDSRSDATSSNFLKATRTFDIDQKEVSNVIGTTNCTYAPAYSVAPSKGALPNSTFSLTSVRTCSSGTTDNFSVTGTAVGLEDVTVAAGTFKAFKYTSTRLIKNVTNESTSVGTYWTDGVTGRVVKFVLNVKGNLPGSTVVTSDVTYTTEAIAYSAQGLGATAAPVKRFAGAWTVPFSGTASGTCSMQVASTGTISGSCNGTGGSSTVSGTVTDAGLVAVQLTDGSRISGSLTSPGAGTGIWVNGTASGTWNATHR